ncbi:hypothetical protein Mal4_20490 [Maioricimonas rarisocia]|uniref:Uncharacterized protein n=1 Tax=Maioricimonas rarisocia TaxID=2528026 RepID=A0A517Z5G7_9PLAN|nr:DUF4175 family protein [Maioricimonas rarisocia]QDU37732.1 hypothetical protein Mal4_20490 [Maioricimonas rarisocia]
MDSDRDHNWALRLGELRRTVRLLVTVRGLALVLTVLTAAALLAGWLDWQFDLTPSWIRLTLLVIVAIAGIEAMRRWLLRPLLSSISATTLAHAIEQRHPDWNDELSTAVEFLESGMDPRDGATALQQEAARRGLERLASERWQDALDLKPVWVSLAGLVAVLSLLLVVFTSRTALATTAFQRLTNPFAVVPWPRETSLYVLADDGRILDATPLQIPQGDVSLFHVADRRGKPPESTEFQVRLSDDSVRTRTTRRTAIETADGQMLQCFEARLWGTPDVTAIRARGGDDDRMPWLPVEVVAPPRVIRFDVTLEPPAYTGLPSMTDSRRVGHIEALVGTSVTLVGTASTELTEVRLLRGDADPIALALGPDLRTFRYEFVVDSVGNTTYRLELVGTGGVSASNPVSYAIRGLADQPPQVRIASPQSDVSVTPVGTVPVVVAASDDFGLAAVHLSTSRAGESEETAGEGADDNRISLLNAAEDAPSASREFTGEVVWSPADYAAAAGEAFTVQATATDRSETNASNPGQSRLLRIAVVSFDRKREELHARYESVNQGLQAVIDQQRDAEETVKQLQRTWENGSDWSREERDRLRRAARIQQAVAERLGSTPEGLASSIDRLLEELAENGLAGNSSLSRLDGVAEELAELAAGPVASAVARMSVLEKGLADENRSAASERAVAEAFRETQQGQQDALSGLEAIVDRLATMGRDEDLRQRFADLVDQQQQLLEETAETARQTLSRSLDDLTDEQRSALQDLSRRQDELTEDLGNWTAEASERPMDDTTAAGAALADVAREIADEGLNQRLRTAARELAANRVAQAVDGQRQAIELLRSLEGETAPTPGRQIEEQLQTIGERIAETESLLEEQRDVVRELADAERRGEIERIASRTSEAEAGLSQRSRELGRALQRDRLRSESRQANRAADAMERAGNAAEQGRANQAREQAEAAVDELKQTRRQLGAVESQLRAAARWGGLKQLEQQLGDLATQQQRLEEKTVAVDGQRQADGRWSRSLLRELRSIGDEQSAVADATRQLVDDPAVEGEILTAVIEQAVQNMQSAAQRLEARNADVLTRQRQQAAWSRLQVVRTALAGLGAGPAGDPQQQPGSEGEGGTPSASRVALAAELAVVREMQVAIATRTAQLARMSDAELTPEQRERRVQLARQQQDLAAMMQRLFERLQQSAGGDVGGDEQ